MSFEKREREKNMSLIDKIFIKPGQSTITKDDFLKNFKTNLGIAFIRHKLNEVSEYLKKKFIESKNNKSNNVSHISKGLNISGQNEFINGNTGSNTLGIPKVSKVSNLVQHTSEFIIQGKRKYSKDSITESFNFNITDMESSRLAGGDHRNFYLLIF